MFGPLKFPESAGNSPSPAEFDFRENSSTLCLLCDEQFILPKEKEEFCTHIFQEHKLVIADVPLIAILKSYVDYWRIRFQSADIQWFCSTFSVNFKEGENNSEEFYLLSDVIQEDKLLREGLQLKRLEWVLEQQESERNTTLSRPCLLCRLDFTGPRADYFTHLSSKHNLQLGAPANLVFTDELLDTIEEKMNRLECLFCEKIFKDRLVLKEHMRKKQHKRINPDNKSFDKFYIVNYLEMGKTWQQMQGEPDDIETLEEASDWSDWNDTRGVEPAIVCLYCEHASLKFDEILNHMTLNHGFNYEESCKKLNLTFYNQVKLVNYIRHQMYKCQCTNCDGSFSSRDDLLQHMSDEGHFHTPDASLWDQPEYFFPTYENDSFLCHLDDAEDCEED